MTCTFFGHRDCPQSIKPLLNAALTDLIVNKNVNMFYVGNNGSFDRMVIAELQKLKTGYPHISFAAVLAYLPDKNDGYTDFSDTVFPEGLEKTPPKFAISKRNMWMIKQSDYVVTYVRRPVGGAAKFREKAEKSGKIMINLLKPPVEHEQVR